MVSLPNICRAVTREREAACKVWGNRRPLLSFPFLLPPWRAPGITPLRWQFWGVGQDGLKLLAIVGRPRGRYNPARMGIRDFIRQLEEHRERLQRGSDLSITE